MSQSTPALARPSWSDKGALQCGRRRHPAYCSVPVATGKAQELACSPWSRESCRGRHIPGRALLGLVLLMLRSPSEGQEHVHCLATDTLRTALKPDPWPLDAAVASHHIFAETPRLQASRLKPFYALARERQYFYSKGLQGVSAEQARLRLFRTCGSLLVSPSPGPATTRRT